jgi:hypothetical protein
VLALLLVLWALLPWSVRGFVTKLKIGHEVLTAASSFFKRNNGILKILNNRKEFFSEFFRHWKGFCLTRVFL